MSCPVIVFFFVDVKISHTFAWLTTIFSNGCAIKFFRNCVYVCIRITGEIVLLNFYMALFYAYLFLWVIIFCVFFLINFSGIHLLSYTREPWWKDINSFQQWLLTTLLRRGVNKKKREFFLFEMKDLWEYVILLYMCKYHVNIAFKNLLCVCVIIVLLTHVFFFVIKRHSINKTLNWIKTPCKIGNFFSVDAIFWHTASVHYAD